MQPFYPNPYYYALSGSNFDSTTPTLTPTPTPTQPHSQTHNQTHGSTNSKPKSKPVVRKAGGEVWQDASLADWDSNDYRIFCGDLGNEVNDDLLHKAFSKYSSLDKVKVIRDKFSLKSRGYGFVSFKNCDDFIAAMREMNGKYVGNRPIKLRKSTWKDRNYEVKSKKELKSLLHSKKK